MANLGNREVMSRNIQKYMAITGKSRRDVSDQTEIKYSTLSEWINCNKYPRIDNIQRLAECFGIDKSALIEDDASKAGIPYNPTHRIPILGRISAGLPLYAEEHIEGYTYTELNHGGEYFALRVTGDSMTAARINEGDILFVRRQDIVENGEIAVVLVNGDDATVKRFHRDGDTVTLSPQSFNPEHQLQVYNIKKTPVRILGRVVQNQISF